MDSKDRQIVAAALKRFAVALGSSNTEISDDLISSVTSSIDCATETDAETRQEFGGGGGPNSMGMMFVRHKRRIVKSLRWQNFQVDVSAMAAGAVSVGTGTITLASAVANPITVPVSLLMIAAGLAFAVWRLFEKQVRWEDACLLHALNERANFQGLVAEQDAQGLGHVLVSEYGYRKGENSNEVVDIIDRLIAWRALEVVPGGYKVLESVKFWHGPWKTDTA